MEAPIHRILDRATIPAGAVRPVPRRGDRERAFDPDAKERGGEPGEERGEEERAAEATNGAVPDVGERTEDEAGGLLDLTA